MELAVLGNYLWFFLFVGLVFLLLAPVLIWKNTANTTRLMVDLLEEQERTNDLLAAILEQHAPSPKNEPTFTIEKE